MTDAAVAAELDRVAAMIPGGGLLGPESPMFRRSIDTRAPRLAAMAAAKQGYDAGRWAADPLGSCPYPGGGDERSQFLRHAWLLGCGAGLRVSPVQEARELEHVPIVLR